MTDLQPDAAKDLLRRVVETLGSANPGGIRGLFADDARIHTTGSSAVSGERSVAELFHLLAKLSATVPAGIKMETQRLIIRDRSDLKAIRNVVGNTQRRLILMGISLCIETGIDVRVTIMRPNGAAH